MKFQPVRQLLIAGLVALPMTFAATGAEAQNCRNGSCGGPNSVEQVVSTANRAMSSVQSASLDSAYEQIESIAADAEEKRVSGQRAVREAMAQLVAALRERAEQQFEEAQTEYGEGYYEQALAKFEEIAALEGLSVARNAQRELDMEDDRSAWRDARDAATQLISNGEYAAAAEPLNDVHRLSRRTGFITQTRDVMEALSAQMVPDVEATQQMIASGQFDRAYATLIEISRLTQARESSVAARRALGQNANVEGMRQARGEYEAGRALSTAQAWYGELTNPTRQEQDRYQAQLSQVVQRFPGTRAADQAQQLLGPTDQQAAR